MKPKLRITYYELLELSTDATIDEIKKSYRNLALKYHPDKNLSDVAFATEKFNMIKEAYTVLVDPVQRKWYDKHKEAFHEDENDEVDYSIDPKYFTTSCWSAMDDSELGFYSTYGSLFDEIIRQESMFKDVGEDRLPVFGKIDSDLSIVKYFYDVWQSFSTAFTFGYLDKYDIRDAPNRKVVRMFLKENAKLRDSARKERNSQIQKLVQFVRKHDPRIVLYREILQAKANSNRSKSHQHRLKVIAEQNKVRDSYVEQDWTSMKTLEGELKGIEAHCEERSKKGKKNNKKNKNDNKMPEPETNAEQSDQNGVCRDSNQTGRANSSAVVVEEVPEAGNADDESDDQSLLYYCEVCSKQFKTVNAFDNHERSKKHQINFERYVSQFSDQGLDPDSSEHDPKQNDVLDT